jgi:glycerol-3-phosphate O-acyltransferase/dihydroxyacetone phosphate acyltransferase
MGSKIVTKGGRRGSFSPVADEMCWRSKDGLAPKPSPEAGLFPTETGQRSLWLLWCGLGVTAVLNAWGTSALFAQFVGSAFFGAWVIRNIPAAVLVKELLFMACDLFFREIGSRGSHKIPKSGPVLFACAPHANQFLDPVVILRAATGRSDIGYIAAAKSMRKRFIGDLAKIMNAIPVERPQDLAKAGVGVLVSIDGDIISGRGTKFSTAIVGDPPRRLQKKDTIIVTTGPLKGTSVLVEEIFSDERIRLRERPSTDLTMFGDAEYKIQPHVDQNKMFEEVIDRLGNGGAVGIFPEGGSHDRTQLLELKPGVAMMVLGAAAKYPGLDIKVIPVGLTYFNGHRFRSRAFIDFGDPIHVDEKLVEQYKNTAERREAVAVLMKQVLDALHTVTVETEDDTTLKFFWALRRLYSPSAGINMTTQQKQSLTRGFAEGWPKHKNNPRVIKLRELVQSYTTRLEEYGVHDVAVHKQITVGSIDDIEILPSAEVFATLLWRCFLVALWSVALVPGFLLALPLAVAAKMVSERKRQEALAGSKVKIEGRDVVATWKVLVSFVLAPSLWFFYTLLCRVLFGEFAAVTFFFFFPFVAWGGIQGFEHVKKLLATLRPLSLLLFNSSSAHDLVALRERCKTEVRAVVEELQWGHNHTDFAQTSSTFVRAETNPHGIDLGIHDEDLMSDLTYHS